MTHHLADVLTYQRAGPAEGTAQRFRLLDEVRTHADVLAALSREHERPVRRHHNPPACSGLTPRIGTIILIVSLTVNPYS